MGVPTIDAYTDPDTPTCFGLYHRRNLKPSGRRCSTYHAFLPKKLVRERRNLTICLGAQAQRILFSNSVGTLRATGILIESKGKLFTVEARHEIILCGGAIVTPQILLLRCYSSIYPANGSGIGPKDHLAEVGKVCLHDLPGVGSTLVFQAPLILTQVAGPRLRPINFLHAIRRFSSSINTTSSIGAYPPHSIFPVRHGLFPQHHL